MVFNRLHVACIVFMLSLAGPLQAAEYLVFYLGGQSNMDGYGYVSELPEGWAGTVGNVMIFQGRQGEDGKEGGGVGAWAPLQPGHGIGFSSDGRENTLSERFGPELAFGRRLAELNPGARIALVKYSRGGTSLLEGASGVFERGSRKKPEIDEEQVKELHAKIGELAVAISFLERKLRPWGGK